MSSGVNYENDILFKTFFRADFNIVPETILIVVGTWIGAERYDRTLGMLVKKILFELNIESDIITDVYYFEKFDTLCKNHIICIGSGNSNNVTKDYEMKEIFGLNRKETTTKIFNEDGRQIAFVYGRGVKETYEATIDFCKENLKSYIIEWSKRQTVESKKNIKTDMNLGNLDLANLLKSIIYSPSKQTSNESKKELETNGFSIENDVNLRTENELNKIKFCLIISLSCIIAMLIFWITFYKSSAGIGVSLGTSLAILFGIPTVYSIYPKKKAKKIRSIND